MADAPAPSAVHLVSRSLTAWIIGLSLVFVATVLALIVWLHLADVRKQHDAFTYSLGRYVRTYVDQALESLDMLGRLQDRLPQEQMPEAMQAVLDSVPRLERLVLLDGYGDVTASVPDSLRGIDLPASRNRPGRAPFVSPRPVLSTATGHLTIFLEAPSPEGGSVGGEMRLNELQAFLEEFFPQGDRRVLALTDRYGNVVAHTASELVRQQANIGHLSILAQARSGAFGTSHYMDDDTLFVGTTAQVPGTNWTILMAQPAERVYLPVLQAVSLLTVSGLVFIPLLVAVLRSTLRRTLSVPLAGLVDSIRAVASRAATDRPAALDSVSEFSRIGDEVEAMAATIRNRERELKRAEEKYRSIFENIPDGFYRAGLDGTLLLANPEAVQMLGYSSAEELLGKNIADDFYASPGDRKQFQTLIHEHGKVRGFQATLKRRDGSHFEAESNSHLLLDPDTGDPVAVEGVFRDVTERKRMQQVMVQTEKMMSVGGLAAGMAHEINNPLAGILQGLQNLQRRLTLDLPANARVASELHLDIDRLHLYMERRNIPDTIVGIRDNAERAAEIVDNMLNFSRTSLDDKQSADLNELVESAVTLASNDYDLKKGYDFRNITILRRFTPDLPRVTCKRTEIEQVLLNLLKNAAHALTPQTLKGTAQITLETFREGGFAVVRVTDNGPGIEESVRSRIFEPFFTTKPPGVGTGLGLSVSYFIVAQNHGGSLSVAPGPEGGTTFSMRLPLVVMDQ